ncbi:MAG: alpha/beta hydrolase [Burkholderiales bacterium]|nr:alpha/beta hydrolase [Burkholderiales bacterium]
MTDPTPSPLAPRAAGPVLHAADLRGLARLGIDALSGVTDVVEGMHAAIARPSWPLGPGGPTRTRGLTGFVYRTVRGTTRAVGTGLDAVLGRVGTVAARTTAGRAPSARREALLAALNGVWGDHLVATGNPLAIPMTLRVDGHVIDPAAGPSQGDGRIIDPAAGPSQGDGRIIDPAAGPSQGDGRRVLVMVHGLCMNDLQWRRNGHDHGAMLAESDGWTTLHVHYNTGLHVADNGRSLDALLEDLIARWPVRIEALALLCHSMGGLVARSACHVAAEAGHSWPASLSAMVFLGTPHHGAPLERLGHVVDRTLGASPYAAPLARLGRGRSAGITDLRHGLLRDEDHAGDDRFAHAHDTRVPTPLPAGVPVYLVAATTADRVGGRRDAWVGDGMVPLASALGEHSDPAFALGVPRARRLVVASTSHWDLLEHPEVAARLRRWLGGPARVTAPAPAAVR